jgi:hypothetical protein
MSELPCTPPPPEVTPPAEGRRTPTLTIGVAAALRGRGRRIDRLARPARPRGPEAAADHAPDKDHR